VSPCALSQLCGCRRVRLTGHRRCFTGRHALLTMAWNACSTPLFCLALVPNSVAPIEEAYNSASSTCTCRLRSKSILFAASTRTMFLPIGPAQSGVASSLSAAAKARTSHLTQLLDPALYSCEAVHVCDVKHEQSGCGSSRQSARAVRNAVTTPRARTVRVPIVDGPQRVEALLPGGVPDGQVECRALSCDALGQIGRLNGSRLRLGKDVRDVAQEQRRLANAP